MKVDGAELLRYWLLLAAALRMLSVVLGLARPDTFKTRVYRLRPDWVNPLTGRVFASWTSLTCMLCVMCAFRMKQEPTLYLGTMLSFAIAWVNFVCEFLVFQTVDAKGVLSPFIVSTVSVVWMAAGWGVYASY